MSGDGCARRQPCQETAVSEDAMPGDTRAMRWPCREKAVPGDDQLFNIIASFYNLYRVKVSRLKFLILEYDEFIQHRISRKKETGGE